MRIYYLPYEEVQLLEEIPINSDSLKQLVINHPKVVIFTPEQFVEAYNDNNIFTFNNEFDFIAIVDDVSEDKYKAVIKELQSRAKDAKEFMYHRANDMDLSDKEKNKLFDLDKNPYTDWEDRENQEYDTAIFKTCNSILEKFNEEQVSEAEEDIPS